MQMHAFRRDGWPKGCPFERDSIQWAGPSEAWLRGMHIISLQLTNSQSVHREQGGRHHEHAPDMRLPDPPSSLPLSAAAMAPSMIMPQQQQQPASKGSKSAMYTLPPQLPGKRGLMRGYCHSVGGSTGSGHWIVDVRLPASDHLVSLALSLYLLFEGSFMSLQGQHAEAFTMS